jgi:hypothetical protein
VRDGELLRVVLCARRRAGGGSVTARILHPDPRGVGYLRDRTFDDAEVAWLEGGDLHRVLELGPTDLHCERRNVRAVSGADREAGFEPLRDGPGGFFITSWDRE